MYLFLCFSNSVSVFFLCPILLLSFLLADITDPIAAFLDMKTRISEAQNLDTQCADIVSKIEFIQHADEEIDWYKELEKAGVTLQDERSIKAKTL